MPSNARLRAAALSGGRQPCWCGAPASMRTNGRLGAVRSAGRRRACAPTAGSPPDAPTACGECAGIAAAMLLRGGPHLSSSSRALTPPRELLENLPLSTWLCFPTTLRATFKATKRTEKESTPLPPTVCGRLNGGGRGRTGRRPPACSSSRVPPPRGFPQPLRTPRSRPGPAPRSWLSLRGCNRPEAPPHESAFPRPPARLARWVGAGPPLPSSGRDSATLARRL